MAQPIVNYSVANTPLSSILLTPTPVDWDIDTQYKPELLAIGGTYDKFIWIIPLVTYNTVLYILKDFDVLPSKGIAPDVDTNGWEVYVQGGGGGGVTSVSTSNPKLVVTNPTTTPNITYQIGGSSKTDDYAMLITDFIILMKATGKTVTLPSATLVTPFLEYTVILGNFATCTVNTVSAQTISGQSTIALTTYQSITVLSDGTNWYLI